MLLFWDTSQHSTRPQLLFCWMHSKYVTLCNSPLHCPRQTNADITGGAHPSFSASLFTGDFCITFFELPCLYDCIIKFSAHRALGGSISSNLTITHLPLNMSTLAASKECPRDGNTAPSKGKSCHLEGNGVARCSACVMDHYCYYRGDFCLVHAAQFLFCGNSGKGNMKRSDLAFRQQQNKAANEWHAKTQTTSLLPSVPDYLSKLLDYEKHLVKFLLPLYHVTNYLTALTPWLIISFPGWRVQVHFCRSVISIVWSFPIVTILSNLSAFPS